MWTKAQHRGVFFICLEWAVSFYKSLFNLVFSSNVSNAKSLFKWCLSPQKRKRTKKTWQKRLDGHHLPRVEEDLRSLFALRMRISRRAKVEMNLAGLFNERKIPHYVDTEVNLRSLFGIKQPRFVEEPVVLSLEG